MFFYLRDTKNVWVPKFYFGYKLLVIFQRVCYTFESLRRSGVCKGVDRIIIHD